MLGALSLCAHGAGPGGWPWPLVGGAAAAVALVAVLACLGRRQSNTVSRSERRELEPMEVEILAALREAGRPVAQSEIGETVPMDGEDIAEALDGLEARGLVRRHWSSERQTYMAGPA